MKPIDHYVFDQFPEVHFDRDEEVIGDTYTHMGCIVQWVEGVAGDEVDPRVISRLKSLAKWCETQPRTESASDDPYTILVVGFHENLFRADKTRRLVPALIDKETFDANAEYLKTWVGADLYDKTAAYFKG